MIARRGARSAAQHHLVAHELAVVFAERAWARAVTGVGAGSAPRPFPNVAYHLLRFVVGGRDCRCWMEALIVDKISSDWQIGGGAFPLELGRQTRAGPVRIRIRFEITEVRNRFRFIDRTKTGEREIPP